MPETIDPIILSELIATHKKMLLDFGVHVRSSTSFETLEGLLPLDGKSRLTEHFRTALNTYTASTAFWVGGFDSEGHLIAFCAARLDDLGTDNLGEYLKRYWRRCYPTEEGSSAQPSEIQPRFWRAITGRVAYYGDFLLKREGYQGRGLPKLFAPLCVLLGVQKWEPDWHYCWVNQRDWKMQLPLAYGFSQINPRGLIWDKPPSTISSDLVAAANNRSNAMDWIDELEAVYLKALNS